LSHGTYESEDKVEQGARQSSPHAGGASGRANEGFEPVRELFEAFLQKDPRYSAGLCAYWRGEKVLDLLGGPGAVKGAVGPVFSVSKGVSALTLSLLVQERDLDLDRLVVDYWPEFGAEGKELVTVRELLTHRVGLLSTENGLTVHEFCNSELAAEKLAASEPCWRPGTAVGYHALTMGVFMEELVRRLTGTTLQSLFAERLRDPYDISFYLGLPEAEDDRFQEMLPAETDEQGDIVSRGDLSDDLASRAVLVRDGDNRFNGATPAFANRSDVRRAGLAAVGGVGSAEGLARTDAAALTGVEGLPPLLSPKTVRTMAQQQVWAHDRVLDLDMCFGVVFMKAQPRMPFASYRGFGHDGAGGALGFADPEYDLGFGYIPGRMCYSSEQFVGLSLAVREAIRGHS
jgi:CubicO group peptidase (beta-lactamase class C family)